MKKQRIVYKKNFRDGDGVANYELQFTTDGKEWNTSSTYFVKDGMINEDILWQVAQNIEWDYKVGYNFVTISNE